MSFSLHAASTGFSVSGSAIEFVREGGIRMCRAVLRRRCVEGVSQSAPSKRRVENEDPTEKLSPALDDSKCYDTGLRDLGSKDTRQLLAS